MHSLILLEPWTASVDSEQAKSVTWSQVTEILESRTLPVAFRYAKEISKLTDGVYLSILVEIRNMIFHGLGLFCKSVPGAFIAIIKIVFVFMGNLQSGVRDE